MKVSRKSWHYKLWNFYQNWWRTFFGVKWAIDYIDDRVKPYLREYQPNSLCPYFWAVVGSLLFTPIGLVLFTLACVGFALLIAIFIPSEWVYGKYQDRKDRKRALLAAQGVPVAVKQPNIFVEFIKARKKKMCPVITLVD